MNCLGIQQPVAPQLVAISLELKSPCEDHSTRDGCILTVKMGKASEVLALRKVWHPFGPGAGAHGAL